MIDDFETLKRFHPYSPVGRYVFTLDSNPPNFNSCLQKAHILKLLLTVCRYLGTYLQNAIM